MEEDPRIRRARGDFANPDYIEAAKRAGDMQQSLQDKATGGPDDTRKEGKDSV